MARAQKSGVSGAKLIPVANSAEWERALRGLPHGPAHTHWYHSALAASVQGDVVLFTYTDGEDRAACPLVLRSYRGSVDIATPYGFGGFATLGSCRGLSAAFYRFAAEQGWVCGYLALHPWFPHPFVPADGLEPGKTVYFLDLSASDETLFASMHETHRYEIRRDFQLLPLVITDAARVSDSITILYEETLARVGAADVYRFSNATLKRLLSSRGCFALGMGEPLEAAILCLYTQDIADYFLNASTDSGRKYTRVLLWAAVRELKQIGVRYFNLGGGIREGDALQSFKRRFGGSPVHFSVLKQIYDRERFKAVCRAAGVLDSAAGYFPPYRSL